MRDTVSEEAVVTDDAKLRDEDVLNEFEDEIFSAKAAEGFGLTALLVEEGDELTVVVSDSGLSQGRFFGITADVLTGKGDVEDVEIDMDVPVKGIEQFFEIFVKVRFEVF